MRRWIAVFLVACAVSSAFARDIRTVKGDVYRDVTITKIEPTGIRFFYSEGAAFLNFSELPEDLKKEFGYSDETYVTGIGEQKKKEDAAKAAQLAAALAALAGKQARIEAAEVEATRIREATAVRVSQTQNYSANIRYSQTNYSTRNYTTERSSSSSRYISSGYCGAPTERGGYCRRKVAGGGRCYQH